MESFDIFNNTVIKSRQNNLISVLYNFFKYYYTITKSDIVINPYVLKNNE